VINYHEKTGKYKFKFTKVHQRVLKYKQIKVLQHNSLFNYHKVFT